tara:strand:+ start:106 stop:717 length:612 start_codon:yes stop_codon:yes gene_type:complete
MLNFLGLGGLLNYNTSIPRGNSIISPPPPPSNNSGLNSLSEFIINAQKDQPSSGVQILPPGSMHTNDMMSHDVYGNVNSTEKQFLKKHGKPFSEMTPEEQQAIQNPQPSEPRSMQDLVSRNYSVNRQPSYQSSSFFNPMPPMPPMYSNPYANPYASPFMGGLSMAPHMGGNFGMSSPFGGSMYGGRMGMMGMGLGGCPPTYGF